MATSPETPSAGEIAAVAAVLARYWPGARKSLALYLEGKAPWEGGLRVVKGLLKEAISDANRGPKIPIGSRQQLLMFAARYGTTTRTVEGTAPLTVKKTVRYTDAEWAVIEAAAAKQGIPTTEFARNAAYLAARTEIGTT